MDKFIDYYKILQVHHEAAQDVIDAAYRCLSKMYHPDLNNSRLASEQMKMINISYEIIGNPKRRKDYHKEWTRRVNGKTVDLQTPEPNNDNLEIEAAERVLGEFFRGLINEEWESTYNRLTEIDRKNITLEDYVEWKSAVSQLYKLGNYKIDYFSKYENCEYAGINYPKILHFSVTLTEMQLATGQVNQEQAQKYIASDKDGWRVCLGYTDLKPAIMKFKYLAQALPKVDKDEIIAKAITSIDPLTGMLSSSGFADQVRKEMLRSERYGNPLSLCIIVIKPSDDDENRFSQNNMDLCISRVSEILCGNIRKTDIIGRLNESTVAILFTETKLGEANPIIKRLLDLSEPDASLNYSIYWSSTGLKGNDNLENVISQSLKKVKLKDKKKPDKTAASNAKLGKYRLSDILEFNKKGRNHF